MAVRIKENEIWVHIKSGTLWRVNYVAGGKVDVRQLSDNTYKIHTYNNFLKKYKKTLASKVLYSYTSYNRSI